MAEAFICDYIRTPIGRFAGALSSVRTDDLAALPLAALKARNAGIDWQALDDVILGCANQAGEDNRNVARMAALLAGLPVSTPGVTVNRLCGSGLDALAMAARAIKAGDCDLIIAGGVESMSRAPLVMPKAEVAFSRKAEIYDTTIGWRFVNQAMKDQYGVDSMPETAENVAEDFNIARADQDAFAARSQARAATAMTSGRLAKEIVPIQLPLKRGHKPIPVLSASISQEAQPTTSLAPAERLTESHSRQRPDLFVADDEHPRPQTTLEQLSKLGTPFRQAGSVTAGNASGVNDGAAALLIASDAAVKRHALAPIARISGAAVAGVEPRIMGFGPAPATKKLLARHTLTIADIDIIELNEAFAAQALAVTRDLGLADDAEHVNPNGGAIALGHPLGMSGARLAGTAALELQLTGKSRALATMCIGVGQGISCLLERV